MNNIRLLYVDLFCGAGGTSTGVEYARHNGVKCAQVVACVNHDKNAIFSHQANHPHTLHFTEDIRTLELSPLVQHVRKMQTVYKNARLVLWASLECTNFSKAKGGQPRNADSRTLAEHLFRYIEALQPDYIQIENVEEFMCWGDLDAHGRPVSRDKGRCYLHWVHVVQGYGYDFDWRILNSADYGAYTSRRRFFGLFAKKGLPIAFPVQTHSKIGDGEPCPTVATQNRLGVAQVAFLSKYYGGADHNQSIEQPAGTITCRDHYAFITAYYGNGNNHSIEEPAPTVTASDRFGMVTSYFLMNPYSFKSDGGSVENPCFTLIARMDKMPPYLITTEEGVGIRIDETDSPMTVKIKEFMALFGIIDIHMRMLNIGELKRIMGFPTDYILVGTQAEQKKFIGNAVEVNMSRVLCEALCEKIDKQLTLKERKQL